MRKPELLAPAGSMEAVRAAVCNGATAVYLGFGEFNARRGAKNFTAEEMREALAYCRRHGVKTNVTVNTIVSDREQEALLNDVRLLLEAGADALIVQDVGVARRIRERFPDAVLHASTQMTIHSLEGALAARRMGFDRVVLSRELPLEEIRYITRNAGIETEIFVHGALCMCYSGQCGLSAVIGRRSGNRGLCAQPCRLPYGGNYPMSLKDLCLLPRLQALCEAGVSSLKIEGRMKRPEYVAIVTKIYSAVLHEERMPTREEMDTLAQVFSRDGFTQGYLDDKIGPKMFGIRTKSSEQDLKPLYAAAAKTYASGMEPVCTIPLTFTLQALADKPMTLTAQAEEHSVTVTGDIPETAQKRATTREDAEKALRKTGGTRFAAEQLKIELADGLRIAAKALNELRRQALEQLEACMQEQESLPPLRECREKTVITDASESFKGYTAQVRTMQQLSALTDTGLYAYYVPLSELISHASQTQKLLAAGLPIVPVLPRIIWDREQEEVFKQLAQCKVWGCKAALCGNIAQLEPVKQIGLQVIGDFGLNAFNSYALETYRQLGVSRQMISFELRLPQIRDLKKPMETELIVSGRLPLMLTENCMMTGAKGGCRRDGTGVCAKGAYYLTDRRGMAFPVFREEHCRNTLYNSQPLFLQPEEYRQLGVTYARLLFTDETPQQAMEITRAVMHGTQSPYQDFTRGLYRRGVE